MGSKRIKDLNAITSLTGADEVVVYDAETDADKSVTITRLAQYIGTSGAGGATSLDGLSDVSITAIPGTEELNPPRYRDAQSLRYDKAAGEWSNVTSQWDTLTLQVAPGGTEFPARPLPGPDELPPRNSGDPFASVLQALNWARANLRITTSLTINIASGTYNEPNVNGVQVGGDGYLVVLVGAGVGNTILADTSGLTSAAAVPGFLNLAGRVRLEGLEIRSTRWAVNNQYGCSTTISSCTLNGAGIAIQALQTRDMQLRFTGTNVINGACIFDNSLAIASNALLTINSPTTPAIWFRGNADLVFGTNGRISVGTIGGNSKEVRVSNASGVTTNPSNWLDGPVYNYLMPQPVRSDVSPGGATIAGASKVFNMIKVNSLPAVPDANTLYLIP